MTGLFMKVLAAAFAVTLIGTCALAQPAPPAEGASRIRTGVVAGRVTLEGDPAPGVRVYLSPIAGGPSASLHTIQAIAITDDDGAFRLPGVPAGAFNLNVAAGAYVLVDESGLSVRGKTLVLGEGEVVDGVGLHLTRGGVITGRVTDADGQPVIGERVSLQVLDGQGRARPVAPADSSGETDDRGVYRVYGLPAGRYIVSVGRRAGMTAMAGGFAPVTYYPGLTDEAKAAVIEITAGREADSVDIVVGRSDGGYNVSGRVVDAETGGPLTNVGCGYSDAATRRPPYMSAGCQTDAGGGFRFERVSPGRYTAFALFPPGVEAYSEPTLFEVRDGDVGGLEIKVRRGSSVSGVAAVEGVNDIGILTALSRLTVYAMSQGAPGSNVSIVAQTAVDAAGSFKLTGVPPGKISLLVASSPRQDFSLLRVEQGGVDRTQGLDVAAGESVTGVRLVLAYGVGNVRGEVSVLGGALPQGSSIKAALAPANAPERPVRFADADAQGRFVMAAVPSGMYILMVYPVTPAVAGRGPGSPPRVRQTVEVKGGADTKVVVVLSLAPER